MPKIIFLAFIFISLNGYAHDDYPNEEQIIEYLAKGFSEKVNLFEKDKSKILTIYLKNKEKAYLLPVSIPNRGRNGMFQTAIIRPTLKEGRILENSAVKTVEAVYDFNNDNVFELVVSEIYSGQGSEIGTRSIIQFDGWSLVVLHQRKVETNKGAYGEKDARFFSQSYWWEFVDLNQDGIIDLKEHSYKRTGRDGAYPEAEDNNIDFIFTGNAYTELNHAEIQH